MAITQDYQFEIGGLTMGIGTDYNVTRLDGLGYSVRARDVEKGDLDGAIAAMDSLQPRTVSLRLALTDTTAANAMGLVDDIKAAWRPRRDETQFKFRIPGTGSADRILFGRPRDIDVEVALLPKKTVLVNLEFEALDPVIYANEVSVTAQTGGAYNFTNGTYWTWRWRTKLNCPGTGTEFIVSTDSTYWGALRFPTPFNGLRYLVGKDRIVSSVDYTSNDKQDELDAANAWWFPLAPGSGQFIFTGNITNWDFAFYPAYL